MAEKYGQHFLTDETVLQLHAATVFSFQEKLGCSTLREIGPGAGVLTQKIIDAFKQVKLFEIDTSFQQSLLAIIQSHLDSEIVWGDVLQEGVRCAASCEQQEDVLVVGNLPYYITSPILRLFFETYCFPGGVFLIQREVAEKIASSATKKSYLRWLLNINYEVEIVETFGPEIFSPPPKVDSSLITLQKVPLKIDPTQQERFLTFLEITSGLKRKTLRKISKMRHEKLLENDLNIPQGVASKRVEELTREEVNQIVSS